MNKVLLLVSLVWLCGEVYAKNPQKNLFPPIDSVVVHLNSAEIFRSINVQLKEGTNRIVVQDLSAKMDQESLQLKIEGEGIKIIGTNAEVNNAIRSYDRKQIEALEDSLAVFKDQQIELENDHDAYVQEKELLKKASNATGSIKELLQTASIYRHRIHMTNRKLSQTEKLVDEQKNLIYTLQARLQAMKEQSTAPQTELIVTIQSPKAVQQTLSISYLVADAGWLPVYTLHAADILKPIDMKFQAQLINDTGIAWEDVNLIFSTARPKVKRWVPDEEEMIQASISNEPYSEAKGKVVSVEDTMEDDYDNYDMEELYVQLSDNLPIDGQPTINMRKFYTSVEYYIPADGETYLIDVSDFELKTNYEYYGMPILEEEAFLMAKVEDLSELGIIEGVGKLYFKDTYLGQIEIDRTGINGTLNLNLGKDSRVLVSRNLVKSDKESKFMGNGIKETQMYEIVVNNTMSVPIKIKIQDQLPNILNPDAKIDMIDLSLAQMDYVEGTMSWRCDLDRGENRIIPFSYALEYSKRKESKDKSKDKDDKNDKTAPAGSPLVWRYWNNVN
ncbi:MAG: DUF4139 domain-containing protein [Chitinophagales bacterium]